jgi:hypothetical protein
VGLLLKLVISSQNQKYIKSDFLIEYTGQVIFLPDQGFADNVNSFLFEIFIIEFAEACHLLLNFFMKLAYVKEKLFDYKHFYKINFLNLLWVIILRC